MPRVPFVPNPSKVDLDLAQPLFSSLPFERIAFEAGSGRVKIERGHISGAPELGLPGGKGHGMREGVLIHKSLVGRKLQHVAGQRVVLTGGASQLQGMREVTARVLDKQVRIGRPLRIAGLAEATAGPGFSACAGLLLYAARNPQEAITVDTHGNGAGRFSRIGRWLKENF